MNRRTFIGSVGATTCATGALTVIGSCKTAGEETPRYLKAYSDLYRTGPRKAALAWFRDARYRLFMHCGLYSIWGSGAWVQLLEKIPVVEYSKLTTQFTAKNFDADFMTDLAVASGMKYVNITAKHHDRFCLFRTDQTDYNSAYAAAKRDVVGDLRDACDKRGLGFLILVHRRPLASPVLLRSVCSTLQHGAWSYEDDRDGAHRHLGTDEVLTLLKDACDRNMNLLLNTRPLPDGSIHPADVATLREVKDRWPLN